MFKKILIANRGEVALRVMRACKELGVKTVAVYSTADEDTYPVRYADEKVCIGPAQANKSYLVMSNIIEAAKITGAEAIHPGYGFLSENAAFARQCRECGVVFVGPAPEVIERMGDKDAARRTARAAGVPVVPGCDLLESAEAAEAEAARIGCPVLIKARSGGGGRGIRGSRVQDQGRLYLIRKPPDGAGDDGLRQRCRQRLQRQDQGGALSERAARQRPRTMRGRADGHDPDGLACEFRSCRF